MEVELLQLDEVLDWELEVEFVRLVHTVIIVSFIYKNIKNNERESIHRVTKNCAYLVSIFIANNSLLIEHIKHLPEY